MDVNSNAVVRVERTLTTAVTRVNLHGDWRRQAGVQTGHQVLRLRKGDAEILEAAGYYNEVRARTTMERSWSG